MSGIDTATALTDSTKIQNFYNQGFRFVGRYLFDKYAMTKAEAQAISAKMNVVSLCERSSYLQKASYFTAAQGSSDASEAITAAKALGQPGNTPIYVCVDFNASDADVASNLTPYFNAVKMTFDTPSLNTNNYQIGIYGSKRVLKAFESICPYRWRVNNTWGEGAPEYTNYNLSQDAFDQMLNGMKVDIDSENGVTGGWRI